ncbi:MAG: class I adenylate cyclase [Gammaproteobacteria bacterium]|nr:class I adenylate cyclase [Gammaproteobacteria bacterium]
MPNDNLTIEQIRQRFCQLNKDRLDRTEELMASRHRALVNVIPLLFHVNHRSLIGYVDETTPCGVSAYTPDDKSILDAKRNWRGFEYKRQAQWTVDIEAIFLMGSCGTVAFNSKSDFDIWLCYRPGLERTQLKRLQKKARLIEKWFDSVDLEVHFFLMSAEGFKKGKVSQLSTESSGTAQHHILLDEFYRTSIWLAGKFPFWWCVPPRKESSYEKIRLHYEKTEKLTSNEYIDFGGLPEIPSGEFFGAAVWQIYKGIDSPYKSVLKITLMEAYANSYPKSSPLSAEFKQKVYDNKLEANQLDPYLLMLERIEAYLTSENKVSRLEVVRRSFYLKLNIAMSNPRETDNWRKKTIQALIKSWGWKKEEIVHLDEKNKWTLEDVVAERKLLVMNLTESYSFLSKFARKHATKRLINQKDLSILGRKLYAVFDRKPGKIEIFNRGIVDDLTEPSITIMLLHGKDKRDHWRLYRGKVVGDQFKELSPLKHSFSLIELVVWSHFNQLFSDTTQKLLYAPGSDVGNSELQTLIDLFNEVTEKYSLIPDSKDLLNNSYVQKSEVFLNVGKQPKSVGPGIDKQLIAGDLDILNYGSESESFVQTLEYFYITSWKEVFVYKYYGIDGLADWMCELLEVYSAAAKSNEKLVNVVPNVHSFGSQISHVLSKRIGQLCMSMVEGFIDGHDLINNYVYEAGKQYYCIQGNDGQYSYRKHEGLNYLLSEFSRPSLEFLSVKFNEFSLRTSPLPVMYDKNKKNVIQFFVQKTKTNVLVYVIDEMGSLFYQKLPMDTVDIVAKHFAYFFSNISERRLLMDEQPLGDIFDEDKDFSEYTTELYQLKKNKFRYETEIIALKEQRSDSAYHIHVEGDIVNKKTAFSFYCDDVEFSSLDWGSKVFREVAKHIIKKRKDHKKYYVYITDLTLSAVMLGKKTSHQAQTVELLKYKKRIEDSLNKALVGL